MGKPLLFMFFIFSTVSWGDVSEDFFKKPRFEIGAVAGFPSVLGLQLGIWGPEDLPFMFRAASGIGSQAELGVHLPISNNPHDRLLISASGGIIGYAMPNTQILGDVGASVGVRLGSVTFSAGPAIYFGGGMHSAAIGAQGSLGFSALY